MEAFDNSGAEFSDGYSGSFSEDSSGSHEYVAGGAVQKVFGQSLSKTTVFSTAIGGASMLTMSDNSKFLVTSSNEGCGQN